MNIKMFRHELSLALVALRRVPGFAITVILTLGITLGVLVYIFSLNNTLLFKALPYPNADQIVLLNQSYTEEGKTDSGNQTVPGMLHWYEKQNVLEQMALVYDDNRIITDHPEQPNSAVNFVTPEYFSLLAPAIHLGRPMRIDEGFESRRPVAVLSYASWLSWYNGNANIIGNKTLIGDVSYEIVGVTGKDFHPPKLTDSGAQVIWLPWDFQNSDPHDWRRTNDLVALGRLNKGVSTLQAKAVLSQSLNEAYINSDVRKGDSAAAAIVPLKEAILGDSRQIALLMLSAVIGLLLIATTNITNLFLSRAAQKQKTMAIQAALGAKPRHLFISMFAESLILCVIAGVFSLIIASVCFTLFQEFAAEQLPRTEEWGLDVMTVVFSVLVVLCLALMFAKLSSRMVNYNNLKPQLHSSGKGSGLQISSATRNRLIGIQVMLVTVLLVGASAVIRQALSTVMQPLGFNEEQVSYFRLDYPRGYEGRTQLDQLTVQIQRDLNRLPQVNQTTRSIVPPIFRGRIARGLQDREFERVGSHRFNQVDANYFELLEMPFVAGQTFTANNDPEVTVEEIILSESLAHHLVPGGDALGKLFSEDGQTMLKVVGIVKDRYNPPQQSEEAFRHYYRPYFPSRWFGFSIKLTSGGNLSKQELLAVLHRIDPKLRVRSFSPLTKEYNDLVYRHKMAAVLSSILLALALVLAAAGIYGVLSYSTTMRRYELGIHLALGAKTHYVLNMVLKESLKPVLLGLASSAVLVLGIFVLGREKVTELVQLDVVTLGIALMFVLGVVYFACYFPIRKVISQDPIKALRSE